MQTLCNAWTDFNSKIDQGCPSENVTRLTELAKHCEWNWVNLAAKDWFTTRGQCDSLMYKVAKRKFWKLFLRTKMSPAVKMSSCSFAGRNLGRHGMFSFRFCRLILAETAVSASVFSRVRNVPCGRNSLVEDFSPHDLADGRALIGGKETVPLDEDLSEVLA